MVIKMTEYYKIKSILNLVQNMLAIVAVVIDHTQSRTR